MTARSPLALLLACAVLTGGLIAAGCGDDDDDAAPTAAAAAGTDDDGAPARAADEIEIADFMYGPDPVTVDAGTKLTWTNADEAPHTATADDGSFDTGTLKLDDSGGATLDQPGTYAYYCRFHPFMKGTIEVR
jgi:plastocyanin